MKLKITKQNAILILVIFTLIFATIITIFILNLNKKTYPSEPIQVKNIGTIDTELDLKETTLQTELKELPLYALDNKVHITQSETIIENMGFNLTREDIIENSYIVWSDGKNQFIYESITDTLSFTLTSRVSITKGEQAFEKIFNQYLGYKYEFKINEEDKYTEGSSLYASRLINGIPVEQSNGFEYSDILKFDTNDNLVAGYLWLSEPVDTELYLPLISDTDLKKYVNLNEFPKERFVDTSVLVSVLDKTHYLDEVWLEIDSTTRDCIAESSELIYLYKNSNQQTLLPVYKYYSNCKVEYEENEYTVPSIFYLSATDPRFITVE